MIINCEALKTSANMHLNIYINRELFAIMSKSLRVLFSNIKYTNNYNSKEKRGIEQQLLLLVIF